MQSILDLSLLFLLPIPPIGHRDLVPSGGLPAYEGTTRYQLLIDPHDSEEKNPTFEKIEERLTRVNHVPKQRIARFASYNHGPELRDGALRWSRITSWRAGIREIKPSETGWDITISVKPNVSSHDGNSIQYDDFYDERSFMSSEGEIVFVDWLEGTGGPKGSMH